MRVCQKGGKVIIPTYINKAKRSSSAIVKLLALLGADFKRQFDLEGYREFFRKGGYGDVKISIVEGRMPCAVAVIEKK